MTERVDHCKICQYVSCLSYRDGRLMFVKDGDKSYLVVHESIFNPHFIEDCHIYQQKMKEYAGKKDKSIK